MAQDKDQPDRMWTYWRDKYGYIEALKQYYPKVARTDLRLAVAHAAILNAQAAIDAVFAEKTTNDDDFG